MKTFLTYLLIVGSSITLQAQSNGYSPLYSNVDDYAALIPDSLDLLVDTAYIPPSLADSIIAGQLIPMLIRYGYTPGNTTLNLNNSLGFYLSTDEQWDAGDSLLSAYDHGKVYPLFLYFHVAPLPLDLPFGSYYLLVFTDNQQVVSEIDESNNVFPIPFKLRGQLANYAGQDTTVVLPEQQLCAGEIFNGIPLYADTVFSDTYYFVDSLGHLLYDSTVLVGVHILPTYETTQEVSLIIGEQYNGQIIVMDTTLVDTLQASNGCDSVVITQISLLTSDHTPEKSLHVQVFPNPCGEVFYVDVLGARLEEVWLEVYNLYGQRVKGFAGNGRLVCEMSDLTSGLYFLVIGVREEQFRRTVFKG